MPANTASELTHSFGTGVGCRSKWVVARLGAAMHYAVPRILHEEGLLERFYTDLYATQGWPRLLSCVPEQSRPAGLRRLLGRVAPDLPLDRIRSYPTLGLNYYLRRARAADWEGLSAVYLWAGSEFGRRVARDGFGYAGAVYTFNSAALEILRASRARGLFTVVEQTMAPRSVEDRLLSEEHARFPGWGSIRVRGRASAALDDREAEEWALADVIACGSEFVREGVRRAGGPADRCVVIPYGVDGRFAPAKRGHDDRGQEQRSRPLRVLTVGEASIQKGVQYAREVARLLKGKAELRWVGSINLNPDARARVAEHLELTGAVPRTQILSHYKWADVFFFPSICEGSATVTYEALSCGLPVVTTPNSGSLVCDGIDGFVTPVRDAAAMADRLQELNEDRALLARMSAAAAKNSSRASLAAYKQRFVQALCGDTSTGVPEFSYAACGGADNHAA